MVLTTVASNLVLFFSMNHLVKQKGVFIKEAPKLVSKCHPPVRPRVYVSRSSPEKKTKKSSLNTLAYFTLPAFTFPGWQVMQQSETGGGQSFTGERKLIIYKYYQL